MTKLLFGQEKRDDAATAYDDEDAADQINPYMSPSQATQKCCETQWNDTFLFCFYLNRSHIFGTVGIIQAGKLATF